MWVNCSLQYLHEFSCTFSNQFINLLAVVFFVCKLYLVLKASRRSNVIVEKQERKVKKRGTEIGSLPGHHKAGRVASERKEAVGDGSKDALVLSSRGNKGIDPGSDP
jgi:hypothetical protein